ncbi:hypothetical protein DKZ29_00265 [Limosilactobacillus reuteri]|uniref:Uncharacterized protein n=1 Tax=Limosilactobacillus reuteri TaxID=1598 RepID=A0A317GDB4_LIMRT|nr:hypothetical protein [Limosilactobacillus reuteri]PWT33449.1 hypothetical protein DKZ21_02930 [Limosilactobacillus reuteri]PWT35819.1 hypothetical protein DKZ24_01880 [Limosilactobacillus reuteri]PWT38554.1 hypothetical protein DKZ35_00265 [Limosilactobacillus reuteri]PWT41802.1 hypothetical protein DKZ34_02040 [Limosilactobacillus reuteri]PWT43261.1 hypothetical protein DKZ22_01380 [Limosilactobacillus reuteri]
MVIFLICILAAIIVIALYLTIHRVFLKRATMMVQKNAQDVTDAALNTSLKEMLHWNKNLNSQIVADVWGKGVLTFEYHFDYKKENINLDDFTRQKLAAKLDEYAKQHQLKMAPNASQPFIITDWWKYEGILHIDIAYLINEATVEYIEDLEKLNQNSN